MKRDQTAGPVAQRVFEILSETPDSLRMMADAVYRKSAWYEAGLLYQKLALLFPHDLDVWRARVECSRRQGHELMTHFILSEAVSRHPEWKTILGEPQPYVAPASPAVVTTAPRRTLRKSCEMIESGLFFSTNKLRVCCTSHHDKAAPEICEYKDGPFPIDKVLGKRAEIREANRAGVYAECNGCPFLKEDFWPDAPSHLFSKLFIGVSSVCPLRCRYCFTVREEGRIVSSDYDLYPICEEFVKNKWLAPDATIYWAGGEPTIFKRFDEMFQLLTSYGNVRHQIYTAATRVSPAVADALRARRALVVCSLDAGTPETYALIKGRNVFHHVVETCSVYASTGGDFRLKYLCLKENARREDADGFVALAARLKVRSIFCDIDIADRSAPCSEVADTLGYLTWQARRRGISVEFEAGSRMVPELRLPDRLTRIADDHARAALRPEDLVCAITPQQAGELTPLNMVSILPGQDAIILRATGNDPYLLLPEITVPAGHRALLSIDITATQDDLLEVYFLDESNREYCQENTVRTNLSAGRQQTVLPAFPLSGQLRGRIRLDPGCFVGDYLLHGLSVYLQKVEDETPAMKAPPGTTFRKSCVMIESGLNLSRNSLRVCCTNHHDLTIGAPEICEFKGGPFPLEKILSKRAEIQEANRDGDYPDCKGCSYLKEDFWPDQPSHLFRIVFMGFSAVCHLRCRYCYTVLKPESAIESDYDAFAICEEMVRNEWLAPDATVFWAGGEPTTFKRFDDMFRLITAYGAVRHQIYTTGVRVSAAVVEALQAKRALVVCSIDAGTPETYAAIKGKNVFHRVLDTCAQYAAAGGDFRLKYLCLKENANRPDADGFIALARRLKIRSIYCDVDYADHSAPCQEIVDTLVYILQQARQSGITVEFEAGSRLVPELRLPERIVQMADDLAQSSLRPADLLCSVTLERGANELTPLNMVSVLPGQDAIILRASGNDPYLLLPEMTVPPGHRALVSIDITAAQDDLLEIYFLDDSAKEYCMGNTVRIGLRAGRQRAVLQAFPFEGRLCGRIRLDPGCFIGDYLLHRLEVYAVKMDSENPDSAVLAVNEPNALASLSLPEAACP